MAGRPQRRNEKVYDDFGQLITSPIRPEDIGESPLAEYDDLVAQIKRGHRPKGLMTKYLLLELISPANTPLPPDPNNAQVIAHVASDLAKSGNMFAIAMIFDRSDGKAVQAISGPDGETPVIDNRSVILNVLANSPEARLALDLIASRMESESGGNSSQVQPGNVAPGATPRLPEPPGDGGAVQATPSPD